MPYLWDIQYSRLRIVKLLGTEVMEFFIIFFRAFDFVKSRGKYIFFQNFSHDVHIIDSHLFNVIGLIVIPSYFE